MEIGKYKDYYINDTGTAHELFYDAVHGKYKDENRWISRDDFFALKETDPYIKWCWSFGNSGQCYMYGKDIENLRRIQWEMCFAKTPQEVRVGMRSLFQEVYDMGLLLCRPDYAKGKKDNPKMLETVMSIQDECKHLSTLDSLQSLQSLQRLQINEGLQRLNRIQELENDKIENLHITNGSYLNVKIKPNSVIYCDIPYKDTADYSDRHQKSTFDYDTFYDWCEKQSEPLFISEYYMPEDRFICVKEIKKRVNMSATGYFGTTSDKNGSYKSEKIFIPKTQECMLRHLLKDKTYVQTELFV